MLRSVGVYVHYPFCRKLCPYCDFAVSVVSSKGVPHRRYLDAVLAELEDRVHEVAGGELATIYLGGGTPSLWPAAYLAELIAAVRAAMPGQPREVTLEANPTDCTAERMALWREAGIGRLSIGVQSTRPRTLMTLGRDHAQGDGLAALDRALGAGFESLSADLILGVPGAGSDVDDARRLLAGRAVPHLSVYELTIENRTHFGKRARSGGLVPLGDDELAERYLAMHQALAELGYEHYEVSSYALAGHRAIHNSSYWLGVDYLGLGAGAASFVRDADGGAVRQTNVRAAFPYMRAHGSARVADRQSLSPRDVAEDLLWLGLRTSDGVDSAAFEGRAQVLERLVEAGLLVREDGRIRPTIRGFLFHDQVASAIVGVGR